MAITHRKRLFARHFAAHADRRAAVLAAGYSGDDWPRTATRLLGDEEILDLVERHQEKELAKFDVARIDDAYVLGQMVDLLERIRVCGMGNWQSSAETKILELLGRYRKLFSDRVEVGLDDQIVQLLTAGRQRARELRPVPEMVDATVTLPALPEAAEEAQPATLTGDDEEKFQ